MSDKSNQDWANPFAALDKKSFPAKRGPKNKPQPARAARAKQPDPADPDGELFAQAMRPVKNLKTREQGRPLPEQQLAPALNQAQAHPQAQTRTEPKPSPAPEPPAQPPTAPLSGSDADLEVFYKAMGDVAPLSGKGREVAPEPVIPPVTLPPQSNPLQDIVEGKVEFAVNCSDEFVEGHVLGLDLLTVGKLQARHYSPEAHIDLHGLNSEQAYANLLQFFRSAYHKGARTLLVVTGRGKNSLNNVPVLRNKIQQWLMQEPFRRVVLAFCTAKSEDGGPGALYVLLRKQRKNSGKVRWDNHPKDLDLLL